MEFHGIEHTPACVKTLQLGRMAVGEFGMLPVVLLAKLLRKAVQGRHKALRLLALQHFLQGSVGLQQIDAGQLIELVEDVMGFQGLHAITPVAVRSSQSNIERRMADAKRVFSCLVAGIQRLRACSYKPMTRGTLPSSWRMRSGPVGCVERKPMPPSPVAWPILRHRLTAACGL